jgi:hypothetical protein
MNNQDIETLFKYQLEKIEEKAAIKEIDNDKLKNLVLNLFIGGLVEWKKRRGLPLDKCLEKMFEIANGYENIKTLGLNYNNIMKGLWNAYNAANNELNNILKAMVESHQKGAYRGDHIINFYESYNRLKDISMALEIEDSDKELPAKLSNALNYGMNFLYAASQVAEQDPILDKNIQPLHLYSDAGLNEYNAIRFIVHKIAEEIELKGGKVDFEQLKKKISEYDFIINKNAEDISDLVCNRQDFYLKKAQALAANGNPYYMHYLNKFIAITLEYSKLLEEDEEDIKKMDFFLNNPCLDIHKQSVNSFYKSLPDISLAKLVIDIELSYINSLKNIDSALNFLTLGF